MKMLMEVMKLTQTLKQKLDKNLEKLTDMKLFNKIIKFHLVLLIFRLPILFSFSLYIKSLAFIFMGIGWLPYILYSNYGYSYHWIFIVFRVILAILIIGLSYYEIKDKNSKTKWKDILFYLVYLIATACDTFFLYVLSIALFQ